MRFKTIFHLLPRVDKLIYTLGAMRNRETLPTLEHLKLCGDWLIYAQEEQGGYAASYSFVLGLRHAYIETTGYIIPTMFDLSVRLADPRFRESALRAGEWLLTVQRPDGSFTDIDEYEPQVFDTGQVMLGFNRLYRETQDSRYLEATRRAGEWLTSVQDEDGSWTSAGYHRGEPCVYLSRVAAAMLEAAKLTGETRHQESAIKFLRWAANRQQDNGYFLNCELIPNSDPVLHTLVYVLEGFLMAYQSTGDNEWLDVLMRGAKPLLRVHLDRDLVPRSQYNSQWEVTNPEKCIPGLAQWAGLCLELHGLTKDGEWLAAAQLSLYYLKSKQLRGSGILRGALPASVPLWGYYHPLMLPNWTVKFFADALLHYDKYQYACWQEQEAWVAKCFALKNDGGAWAAQSRHLEPLDQVICSGISDALVSGGDSGGRVLDLGCGEGRYMKHLQGQFPDLEFLGVDPCVLSEDGEIRHGSAYKIPFPNNSFETAYTWITLQHIDEISRSLGELRRVLKPDGRLVIGDRDLVSGRGLSKPWHEFRGRWMYPWDSPFRERWYSMGRWKKMLKEAGFEVEKHQRILNPSERGWRRLARMNGFLLLTVRKCESP